MSFEADVDAVDWDNLHHAYGPASDVPDLLRALMSPEQASPALREEAEKKQRSVFDHVGWTLWGNVFHQGSVWQVSAATVPLFISILRDGPRDAETKVFLITYLHHLALGYPDDLFPDRIDPDEGFASIAGQQDPGGAPDYGADDNRPLIWMRDCYEAVERHVEDVLPYLDAPDDTVADAAIALCASFSRRSEISTPALRRIAATADRRGATAAISLAALRDPTVPEMVAPMVASSDPVTAVLGGCAVAILDPTAVTPDSFAALTTPLGEHADMEQAHASTLRTLVGRCLVLLGPDFRECATDQLCSQLSEATPMESLTLTQSLLRIVFPELPPPEHATDLSGLQRKALEAIRDHGAFRVSGGRFSNYASILQGWGLPATSDDLGRWLAKS